MGTVIDVPTFYPTEEEFADFSKYISYIEDKYRAHEYGLVKVIPPKSWVARANYEGLDDVVMVTNPIEQEIQGQHGAYQAMNLVRKHMTMGQFKKIAESPKHAPPACHENYKELERYFWKNVTFNKAIYGADVPGTLFDEDLDVWNLSRLDTMLNIIHEEHDVVISGVNTAYLYFGMWKSAFAWHTEDMNLYSINYLHFGHPKSWYGIPPAQGKKLEDLARLYYAEGFNHCKEFLRHKSTMLAPALLKKSGVPYIRAIQQPGEFMITFPYSYHAGFNHGFNCAEATNFASDRWIDWGIIAQSCLCRPDTVRINTDIFVKRFRPEQWAEMHPNDTDPEDCGGPIKRRMGGGRSMGGVMGGRNMAGVKVKRLKGESGREESEVDSKRKAPPPPQKMTKEMAFAAERDFNRQVSEGASPHQPICAVCRSAGTSLAMKPEAGEEGTGSPVTLDQSLFEVVGGDVGATGVVVCATCCVAVHTVCYGISHTDLPDPSKWQCDRCVATPSSVVMCELCPNAGGAFARCHGNRWVHVQCAQWVPEATLRLVEGSANQTCWDISKIPQERWALKCKVCVDSSSVRQREQKGVCVQCCDSSCTVGYHVTCAQDTGHGACDWGNYPLGPWWLAYCTQRHMPIRLRQLESGDTSKYSVGTRVMCRFPQDNCHYPGTIVAINTDYKLHWREDEGKMVCAQPKEVVVVDGDGTPPSDARLYQGRKVECIAGKNRYSFGIVEQIEGNTLYRVHFDDGYVAPKAKFTDLVLLERWETDRPPGARAGEESVVPLCVTGQTRRRNTTEKPKDEGLKIRRTLRHMVEESEVKERVQVLRPVTAHEVEEIPKQPQGRPIVRLAGQTPTHLYISLQPPMGRLGIPPLRFHCVVNVLGGGQGWKKIGKDKGYDVVLKEEEGGDQYEEVVYKIDCAIDPGMKFMMRGYIQNGWGLNGFNSTSNEMWDSDPSLGPPDGFTEQEEAESQVEGAESRGDATGDETQNCV